MNQHHSSKPRQFGTSHERGTPDRLRRAMAKVNLRVLCDQIYGLRKRDGYYFSPVRDDGQNPAFGIRADGEVGVDHATGEGFNALTLIAKLENLTPAEARERLIVYAEGSFDSHRQHPNLPAQARVRSLEPPDRELYTYNWPPFGYGTATDYLQYGTLRGLNPAALLGATCLLLFFFFADSNSGQRLCTVTDDARYVRQDRCIDESEVILSSGGKTKNRTIGAGSWPVGAANIGSRSTILLVEGMPDLLAAVQVVEMQRRHQDTAVVAMLGAGQRMHPAALPHFAGKRVRLFPHNDVDGKGTRAAACWTQQLHRVTSEVDSFCFAERAVAGQKPVKDLNDFVIAGGQAQSNLIPTAVGKGGNDV